MHNPFTTILGRQWFSYTVLLMVAAGLTLAWLISRSPEQKRTATFDIFLSGLSGGIVVGRVIHVLMQWQYFSDRTDEIRKIYYEGGLNWHGIVIGALFASGIMAYFRKVDFRDVLDDIALILPVLSLFGWWACGTIGCAYGLPVERMADYPQGFTWIQPDIFGIGEPRFATQGLGITWAICVFVLAALLHRRDWLTYGRFWLILLLQAIGSFGIAFLRGDFSPMLYSLRVDQWLDIGMMLYAIPGLLYSLSRPHHRTSSQ